MALNLFNITSQNFTAHGHHVADIASVLATPTKTPSPAESTTILADPQITAFLPDITYSYADNYYGDGVAKAYGDNTTYNLTEYCTSPYDMWLWTVGTDPLADGNYYGIYQNFNSCVALTNITRDLDSGVELSENFLEALHQYNVTGAGDNPKMKELVEEIRGAAVQTMQQMCSVGKCNSNEENKDLCTAKTLFVDGTGQDNLLSFEGFNSCQNQICSLAKQMNTDDADIGGIGVFIAYGLQLLIAAALFIICICDWICCAVSRRFYLKRKSCFLQRESFINLLINFHKAQIFFVISIMVAAYIKMHKTGDVSSIDRFFLLLVAVNGVTLLTFTLLTVYMIAGRSLYMLWTTLAGYLLCAALFLEIIITRQEKFAPYIYVLEFCTYWSKGTYSFVDSSVKKQDAILLFMTTMATNLKDSICYAILVFTLLVMVFLIAHQFGTRKYLPEPVKTLWRKFQRWLNLATMIVVLSLYGAIVGGAIYLMKLFYGTIHTSVWNFGQIVAVFVWVPVLADYLHDLYVEWKEHKKGECKHEKPTLPMHRTFSYEIDKKRRSKPLKSPLPDFNKNYVTTNGSSTAVSELEGSTPENEYYNEKMYEAGLSTEHLNPTDGLGGLTRPPSPEEVQGHAFGSMNGDQPAYALRTPTRERPPTWYNINFR